MAVVVVCPEGSFVAGAPSHAKECSLVRSKKNIKEGKGDRMYHVKAKFNHFQMSGEQGVRGRAEESHELYRTQGAQELHDWPLMPRSSVNITMNVLSNVASP